MVETEHHERFMREAIKQALLSDAEKTWPNPRVGAVIVESGVVVSRGRFKEDGGPHAEREALANLGRNPDATGTLYVTLEPCSTHGRTGACTQAILESGIRQVVVGVLDPTPAHRGMGFKVLSENGVTVISGVLKQECEAINPGFAGHET